MTQRTRGAARLLDAVVHVVDGSGPGRLEVTNEMQQGAVRGVHAGRGSGGGQTQDSRIGFFFKTGIVCVN